MKKYNLSTSLKGILGVGMFSAILVTAGCDVSKLQDAADDFGVVIGLEEINTNSTVLLTDAKTGELIDQPVAVAYDGPNAGSVIDMYSDPVSSADFRGGVFNFGIDNELTPTAENPAHITLNLTANGYLSSSRNLFIADTGSNNFQISLVNLKNLPEGIKTQRKAQGTTNADGSTTQEIDIEVNTDESGDPDAGMSMRIAQGTTFKDAEGNTLKGKLRSESHFFDPGDSNALSALPQDEIVDEEGNSYAMAGASMINIIDENGKSAASAVSLNSKISSSSVMEEHGAFEVEFAVPKELEGENYNYQLIAYDGSKPVVVEPTASHSKIRGDNSIQFHSRYRYFRFGWYPRWVYFVYRPPTCTGEIAVNRNGNEGYLRYQTYTYGRVNYGYIYPTRNNSFIYNIRRGAWSNVTIYSGNGNNPVQVTHNFCSSGRLTVNLPAPPPQLIDSHISAQLACENPNDRLRVTNIPSASVTYRKTNAPLGTPWQVGTNLRWKYDSGQQVLTGGSFRANGVERNEQYRFKISFDGKYYERDITVTGPQVTFTRELDSGICS